MNPAVRQYLTTAECQFDAVTAIRPADDVAGMTEAGLMQGRLDSITVAAVDLDHTTQFLGKQGRHRLITERVQLDGKTTMAGKRHFSQCDKQSAIGSIVIGQQQTLAVQLLYD